MTPFRNILTQSPTADPLTLQEATDHLREATAEQPKIALYLKAATQSIEQELLNGNLMQATYSMILPDWYLDDDDCIIIPQTPLVNVVSVQYYDLANLLQTLAPSNYQVHTASLPGRVRFVGISLPSVFDRLDAIIISYKSGYGASGATDAQQQAAVPFPLKAAVLMRLGQLYENRQEEITGATAAPFSIAVERLIAPYRIPV